MVDAFPVIINVRTAACVILPLVYLHLVDVSNTVAAPRAARLPRPPQKTSPELTALWKFVAEHSEKDFLRANEFAKTLETRAQSTITVAGVFLGGAMAFAKDIAGATLGAVRSQFIATLATAVVLLVLAVILSVLALQTRSLSAPVSARHVRKLAMLVSGVLDRTHDFYGNIADDWKLISEEYWARVRQKGALVGAAQFTVLLAAMAVAAAVLIRLQH